MTAPQVPPQRSGVDYTDPIADLMRPAAPAERVILVGKSTARCEAYARTHEIDANDYTIVVRTADLRRLTDRDTSFRVVDRGETTRDAAWVTSLVRALEGAGKWRRP